MPSRPSSFALVPESNEVKGVKVSGSRMRAASICSLSLTFVSAEGTASDKTTLMVPPGRRETA